MQIEAFLSSGECLSSAKELASIETDTGRTALHVAAEKGLLNKVTGGVRAADLMMEASYTEEFALHVAALLVELFPARIRYSAMSLPYHIGNGWFGGFLPTTAFAIVAATGNIYNGPWYPIVVAGITLVVGLLFLPETYRRHVTHPHD